MVKATKAELERRRGTVSYQRGESRSGRPLKRTLNFILDDMENHWKF